MENQVEASLASDQKTIGDNRPKDNDGNFPKTNRRPMPFAWTIVIALYLIALNLLLVSTLIRIWPSATGTDTGSLQVTLVPGTAISIQLTPETRLLLIVSLAGALGSYVHLTTSFVDFVGNRELVSSWGLWYVLRPFIGVSLAMIIYFLVRGGLVTTGTPPSDLSPFGIAALASMAGLFTKQATDKLREVFENLFHAQNPTQRSDSLTTGNAASIPPKP